MKPGRCPGLVGIPAREWDQRRHGNSSSRNRSPGPRPRRAAAAPAAPRASRVRRAALRAGQPSEGNQGQEGEEGDGNQDSGDGEGENRQYAVMIIASQRDPVYAADGYFGLFDGVYGLSYSREEPLNELVHRRLFETWEDPEPPFDRGRSPIEHGFFSTISERAMPYRPLAVEPTVQQRRYHPFDLSYRVISQVSTTDPDAWRRARPLNGVPSASA